MLTSLFKLKSVIGKIVGGRDMKFGNIVVGRDLNIFGDIVGGFSRSNGNGTVVSEERDVGFFEHVQSENSADLEVSFGDAQSVTIVGEKAALDAVTLHVTDDVLRIFFNRKIRTSRGVVVRIVMPGLLRSITLEGSGDAVVVGVNQDDFEALLTGSGDLSVDGRANRASYQVHGSGDVRAKRLKASDVSIESHGSGDIRAHASFKADITATSSGDVTISGGPTSVDKHKSGSGGINVR